MRAAPLQATVSQTNSPTCKASIGTITAIAIFLSPQDPPSSRNTPKTPLRLNGPRGSQTLPTIRPDTARRSPSVVVYTLPGIQFPLQRRPRLPLLQHFPMHNIYHPLCRPHQSLSCTFYFSLDIHFSHPLSLQATFLEGEPRRFIGDDQGWVYAASTTSAGQRTWITDLILEPRSQVRPPCRHHCLPLIIFPVIDIIYLHIRKQIRVRLPAFLS